MTKQARITKAFRIAIEGGRNRRYLPGDVAEDDHADWAIDNGYGVEIDEDGNDASGTGEGENGAGEEGGADTSGTAESEQKAAPPPENKAKPEPKNKGAK